MYLTWFVGHNVSFLASCPWPCDFETKSSPAFQIDLMRWPIPISCSGTRTRCSCTPFPGSASVPDWTWSSAAVAPDLLSVAFFRLKTNHTLQPELEMIQNQILFILTKKSSCVYYISVDRIWPFSWYIIYIHIKYCGTYIIMCTIYMYYKFIVKRYAFLFGIVLLIILIIIFFSHSYWNIYIHRTPTIIIVL